MARSYTLGDLTLRCQQRADKENDGSIDTAEWQRLISEQYGELYSLVEKSGMRYFETEVSITATGAASYTLPTDHLSTIYISRVYDTNGHERRLRRLLVQERPRWKGMTGDARRYELAGTTVALWPTPASGTYKHLYMPQAPDLSTANPNNTSVDLVQADGEAFLIWGVAVKALGKGESDVQLAITERDAARNRFNDWCALRCFNDSSRVFVEDTTEDDDFDGLRSQASYFWNPP